MRRLHTSSAQVASVINHHHNSMNLRSMRFGPPSSSSSGNKSGQRNTTISPAPLASISKPVALDNDFTPFPLPKYDPVSELEPSLHNIAETSVDGAELLAKMERRRTTATTFLAAGNDDDDQQHNLLSAADRRRQAERSSIHPAANVSTMTMEDGVVDDDVLDSILSEGKYATAPDRASRFVAEEEDQEELIVFPQSNQLRQYDYIREPVSVESDAAGMIDRPYCLRDVASLIAQLKDSTNPNFERNLSALSDITHQMEDFLIHHGSRRHPADVDDESAKKQAFLLVEKHRAQVANSIMEHLASTLEAVRSMFVGTSRALYFNKRFVANQRQGELPADQRDYTAQRVFFKYFNTAEKIMTEHALPQLEQLLLFIHQQQSEATTSNNNGEAQQEQQQKIQQEAEKVIEGVTQFMKTLAHFQLVDHRRHFDQPGFTSGALRPRDNHMSTFARHSDATGESFFWRLSDLFSSLPSTAHDRDHDVSDDDAHRELMIMSQQMIKQLPTSVLAKWLLLFGSSYMRTLPDVQPHPELRQGLVRELLHERLLPACKQWSAASNDCKNNIFADHRRQEEGGSKLSTTKSPPLLLQEIPKGSERVKVIADILLGCALTNVTLPSDFLEEAIIDPALELSESDEHRGILVVSSPNIFIALAKLMGSKLPSEKIFRLAELEFQKFQQQKQIMSASDQYDYDAEHLEHDWIAAMYEIAFASHNRPAAVHFLKNQVHLNTAILERVRRFANDISSSVEEDDTPDIYDAVHSRSGGVEKRAAAISSSSSSSSSLAGELIHLDETNGNIVAPLGETQHGDEEEMLTSIPKEYFTLLGSANNNNNNNNNNNEGKQQQQQPPLLFANSVVGRKIATKKIAHIFHHSLLRGPSIDGLISIVESCRDIGTGVLVVPATCLYMLAVSTADTSSASGRVLHRDIKKRAVRAIFEELECGSAVLVTPEEEIEIRANDGYSDGDFIVWDVSTFVQSRAPATLCKVECASDSKTAYFQQEFQRPQLATIETEEQAVERRSRKAQQEQQKQQQHVNKSNQQVAIDSSSVIICPEGKSSLLLQRKNNRGDGDGDTVATLNDPHFHMPRTRANDSPRLQLSGFVNRDRLFKSEHPRILDPRSRKFQPGVWSAGNRGTRNAQFDRDEFYLQGTQRPGRQQGKFRRSRRLKGHAVTASMEDLRGLGIYTPHN